MNPGSGARNLFSSQQQYCPQPCVGTSSAVSLTVIQSGWRTHYYYSTYYTQQPSDRYFNGIAGCVFPPLQTNYLGLGLRPLKIWYSSIMALVRIWWHTESLIMNSRQVWAWKRPLPRSRHNRAIATVKLGLLQFPPTPNNGPLY